MAGNMALMTALQQQVVIDLVGDDGVVNLSQVSRSANTSLRRILVLATKSPQQPLVEIDGVVHVVDDMGPAPPRGLELVSEWWATNDLKFDVFGECPRCGASRFLFAVEPSQNRWRPVTQLCWSCGFRGRGRGH